MRRRSGCVLYDRQDLYRVRTSFGMEAGCERRMCMEQGFLSRSCSKKRPEASLVRPKYRMTSIGAQRVQCSNWYYVKEKSPVFVENIIGHATRTCALRLPDVLACVPFVELARKLARLESPWEIPSAPYRPDSGSTVPSGSPVYLDPKGPRSMYNSFSSGMEVPMAGNWQCRQSPGLRCRMDASMACCA